MLTYVSPRGSVSPVAFDIVRYRLYAQRPELCNCLASIVVARGFY
jgi:hypothetical protein